MRSRRILWLVALFPLASLACSAASGEKTASTSQGLDVRVALPIALGGYETTTHYTPRAPAKRVFPMGLTPSAPPPMPPQSGLHTMNVPASLPQSADLSAYAPSAGDQGGYGSCASWSTGYSTMGWWANKTGLGGNPFNPVFLYSQLMTQSGQSCGPDNGTSIEQPLQLMQSEGDDTLANFPSTQCSQPTQPQIQNAGGYRITGFQQLDLSGGARQALEAAISGGQPVAIAIWVYDEFMNADASSYYVGLPGPGSTLYGAHAISAQKYDDNGVWILNSWGVSQWGIQGWAELSWDFVSGTTQSQGNTYPNVFDAAVIDGVVGAGGSGGGSSSGSGSGSGSSSGGAGCTFSCSDYGYAEGQCVQGWLCSGGCITYDGCQ